MTNPTEATQVATRIDPGSQFVSVSVFLFLFALVPFLIHPQVKHNGRQAVGYLLAMAGVAMGITLLGQSDAKGWAAPLLLLYWGLVAVWTVMAIGARHRHHGIKRKVKADAAIRARFDHETGSAS